MEGQGDAWTEEKKSGSQVRAERLLVEGDLIKYTGNGRGIGVYVSQEPVTVENNYFEITILNTDMFGAVSIGVCHVSYPLNKMPGWDKDSLGYHGDDGMLYRGNALGYRFGPRCGRGDRMGCGVRPVPQQEPLLAGKPQTHYVYFTRNGKEIGCVTVVMPQGGLYPCLGLAGPQDVVRLAGPFPPPSIGPLLLSPHSPPPVLGTEEAPMAVDHNEDDWARLHDVKLNGQCVSYSGRGLQIEDIGLAVAKHALSPASHYFQLQIMDPGENTYITIGITKKKYPQRCHPGWRDGSVAYHADDGRVFTGCNSVKGLSFGPPCGRGDVMGCGILFPRNYSHSSYVSSYDDSSGDETDDCAGDGGDLVPDSGDDDEYEDYITSPGELTIPRNISEPGPDPPDQPQTQHDDEVITHDDAEDEENDEDEEEDVERRRRQQQQENLLDPPPKLRNSNRRRKTGSGFNSLMLPTYTDDEEEEEEEEEVVKEFQDVGSEVLGSNGFIDRRNILIKELRTSRRRKRDTKELVVQVFFTRNGFLLGRVEAVVPKGGFFPTISLGGRQETVKVDFRPLSG